MKDTIKLPTAILGAAGGWYYDDTNTLRNATSINALGYENLWGNVSEWMEGFSSDYWVCTLKDQGDRKVKSATISDSWITELHNGRFMDVVPVLVGATETTHYGDKFWGQKSPARVGLRSGSTALPSCGVSCAYALSDASHASAGVGSRLAFIGKIVYTLNVATFLEAEAIG